MHLTVMDTMTITLPIRANTPGRSPSKRRTQIGFNSGSTALSRLQARGGQWRLAFTYRM